MFRMIYRFDNDVVAGYLARACFWSERYGEAIVYGDRGADRISAAQR